MLIPQLCEEFQHYLLTERAASPASVSAYTATLRRLSKFVETECCGPVFESISTANLRRFIAWLKRTEVSNATIARHVHGLRSFWRFVVETHDLGANAALPLRAPRPDHRVPNVLTAEECKRLIAAAEKNHFRLYRIRDRVLLKLMLLVGFRRSEVIAARVRDYSPAERTLIVSMSKGRKSRVIPLPGDLCADIDAWLPVRPQCPHDRLLTTRTGTPLSPKCLYRALNVLGKHAGLEHRKITPHMLRHTAATLVLRSSGDLLATSRLLGHSSVAVTGDTYCHLTNDDIRGAVSFHPLANASDTPHTVLDPRLGEWQLPIPADRMDLVAEAERVVETARREYSQTLSEKPHLAERWQTELVVEAIRHNVRPNAAVSPQIARAVAREGRVVEGYSMAEHMRMVAFKDILTRLASLADCSVPWSELLPEVAGRISGAPVPAREPWQRDRIDDIGRSATAEDRDQSAPLRQFAHTLAQIAMIDAFGRDSLLIAQIAANMAVVRAALPLAFFAVWDKPPLRLALEQARRGDGSVLRALVAARIAEICEAVTK